MSMFNTVFGTFRDAVLLTERLNNVSTKADQALDMARENRERLIRLETLMEFAMRAGPAHRLPPQ